MENKQIVKQLLLDNPSLNNVAISKLYENHVGETVNYETFRKVVGRIRKKLKMGNPSSKYTSKKFYNTGFEKKQTDDDKLKDQYRFTKVNSEKGTLESEIVISFEPRNDEELASLHKVDLNKYRISNYWTKLQPNGNFTSSLLCTLRKVGDSIDIDEAKRILAECVKDNIVRADVKTPKYDSKKTLMFWISDEHVGASVSGSIFDNKYNEHVYYQRKENVIKIAKEEFARHGGFDKIIFCSLGDNLDGFNGKTTRSLTGAPTHKLEQNMTNEEAIKAYVDVNKVIFDSLVDLGITNKFVLYNVNNSNHGGLGFDGVGNFALRQYLETKYGELFEINDFKKIIDTFDCYGFKFFLAHGKDEEHMKKNMPIMLNPQVENYIKEVIDEHDAYKDSSKNIFVKGDLHQFATQQGRWFVYQNCPSMFGSSAWVHANIGKGKSGFAYSIVEDGANSVSFIPYWTT